MDEATANIDSKTDSLVQHILNKELKSSTILTIAHRLNTIILYDKLIILNQGTIEEIGSPKELLMKEGGSFQTLVKEEGDEFF